MTNIDRRRFVTSLGAATALPAMTCAAASSPQPAVKVSVPHERPTVDLSFMARHVRPDLPDSGVDFWSRPWCDIAHARYLPREIARGTIWHERCDKTGVPAAIEAAASDAYAWTGQRMPRFAACADRAAFPSVLTSLVGDGRSGSAKARTALIALDSLGPSDEPDWADVLPAFRTCYGRIVGHFHLERRGLRQWKAALESWFPRENGRTHFESFFLDAAAQCDAVILTSPALVEYDSGFSPRRASTEELVGQQIRRLGCALLDRTVIDQIAGPDEKKSTHKPRLFALGSNAFHSPGGVQPTERLMLFDYLLFHQEHLIQGAFGERVWSEGPLLVVTYDDHRPEADILSGRANAYKLAGPTYEPPGPRPERQRPDAPPNVLELIALWPFEFDG